MKQRNIYISNMDVEEAKKAYFDRLFENMKDRIEEVCVFDSLNRVTAVAVYAPSSSPHYNASAMDGIAVISEKTKNARETNQIHLKEGVDFEYVNTGNPINDPYDSVIMIEDVINAGSDEVSIINGAYPWQHIRPIGEDIVFGEMIVSSNHKIRALDLGALIASGVKTIKVYKKPSVGVMPTGSEIVEDIDQIKVGKIIDSNSRVFCGLVEEYGGVANRYSPCEDDYELLKTRLKKAIQENDIVVVNAGSSAGSKDYTPDLIRELGEVMVHGVALKPGKPTILGIIDQKPVIGIPGYPVSAYLTFETFVKPLVFKMLGREEEQEDYIKGILSKRLTSSFKHKELVRVNLGYVNEKLIATPLTRGAGVTMSLVKADGILEIDRNIEGVEAGQEVLIKPLNSLSKIRKTLVSIGSHDVIMDEISDMMSLSSGHVGSMGGIMAMKRGECHIAPIHLLDESSGEYNISYVQKYFGNKKMALIKGVKRLQGLMVEKGNPKNITKFEDLLREDVSFINRQRGAGTRILLDYNLKKLNLDPNKIIGYEREMTTHMAVASGVKTKSCDVGLGIHSAAFALDLEFIPIGFEEYDFLVEYENLSDPKIINFIEILKSDAFKSRLDKLKGYETSEIGKIIKIGE